MTRLFCIKIPVISTYILVYKQILQTVFDGTVPLSDRLLHRQDSRSSGPRQLNAQFKPTFVVASAPLSTLLIPLAMD